MNRMKGSERVYEPLHFMLSTTFSRSSRTLSLVSLSFLHSRSR